MPYGTSASRDSSRSRAHGHPFRGEADGASYDHHGATKHRAHVRDDDLDGSSGLKSRSRHFNEYDKHGGDNGYTSYRNQTEAEDGDGFIPTARVTPMPVGVDVGVGVDVDVVRQTYGDPDTVDSRMSVYADDVDDTNDDQMRGMPASQQVAERYGYSAGDDTYASGGMGIGNPSVPVRHSSLGTDTGRASRLSVGHQSPGRLNGNDIASTAARASEPLTWHRSEAAASRDYQPPSMAISHGWESKLGSHKNSDVERYTADPHYATEQQAGYYRQSIPAVDPMSNILRTLFLRIPTNPTVSRKDIHDWFAAFGEVENVLNICLKGICYVMYYDSRCAQKALRQAGKHVMINGCHIGVFPSKHRPGSAKRSPTWDDHQATVLFTLVGENAAMDESARVFFEKYGEIDGFFPFENRENEWVAEYFDIRAAADAISKCHDTEFRGGSLYTTLLWDGSVARPIAVAAASVAEAKAHALQARSYTAKPMHAGSTSIATTEIKSLAKEGLQQSLPEISELAFRRSLTEGVPTAVGAASRVGVPAPALIGLPQMPAMKKRATAANWIGGAESIEMVDAASASLSELAASVHVSETEPSSNLLDRSLSASDSSTANLVSLPTCDDKVIPPVANPKTIEPVDMVARLKLDPSLLQKAQAAKAILQKHHLLGMPSSDHKSEQMGATNPNVAACTVDNVPLNGANADPTVVSMQRSSASGSILTLATRTAAAPDLQAYRDGSQNVGPNLDKLLASKRSLPMSNTTAMPALALASASGSPPYSPLTAVHPMQSTKTASHSQSVAATASLAESPPQTAVESGGEGGGGVHSEGINRLLGILAQVQKGTPSSSEATAASAAERGLL
ncbi:hypothetical protein LPJ53_002362 [Coemansia erecta]|uniref:RRM domain-containing protein n=1 Tax=Coemansia erecta TaxID=147472 RepID=A0A9W8CRW9_9FUNG|nr:hypothetical protein LPJ53_002362 [Coemansia erecta]